MLYMFCIFLSSFYVWYLNIRKFLFSSSYYPVSRPFFLQFHFIFHIFLIANTKWAIISVRVFTTFSFYYHFHFN